MARQFGTILLALALSLVFGAAPASTARGTGSSGPIQLGGDDQNDHGSSAFVDHDSDPGTPDVPATEDGWRYIMLSLKQMLATELRSGASNSIAVLGTDGSTAYVTTDLGLTPDDGGASCTTDGSEDTYCMMEVVKAELDRLNGGTAAPTVTYYETAAEVDAFFDDLASGALNVAVIYIPGDGGSNDLGDGTSDDVVDSDELTNTLMEQALIDGAPALRDFNAAGGGILASGKDNYRSWLKALLPSIDISDDVTSSTIGQTADGIALWSGLTDSNISSAWHNHFIGDLGALKVLGLGWDSWTDADADGMIDSGEATALLGYGPDEISGNADDFQTVVIIGGAAGEAVLSEELPETNKGEDAQLFLVLLAAALSALAGTALIWKEQRTAAS